MHVSPSKKRYIGITSYKKVEYRWNNGKGYKNNIHFTNAINKYGWDNFEHIIIAKGLTEDEAKWLEIELIREWDSTNQDKGYNVTMGGEGVNGYHHTEQWKQDMSKRMSGENHPMYGRTGELSPSYGRKHTEEEKQKMSENHCYNGDDSCNAKPIILLNTKEIFPTIAKGARNYKLNRNGISQCCNNHQKKCGKLEDGTPLVWMFYNEYLQITEEEVKEKLRNADTRVILLNTKEIFDTTKEGAEKYNTYYQSILECCNNTKKSSGKLEDGTPLVWMYYNEYLQVTEEEIQNKIRDADTRVVCITTNEVFNTIKEGAEKYNIHDSGISKCCNNKCKSSGKHPITDEKLIWKFYKDML